jgi:hypothetical protein
MQFLIIAMMKELLKEEFILGMAIKLEQTIRNIMEKC